MFDQRRTGLWYEKHEFAVDGVYRKDDVFADVGVAALEARAADWGERFEESGILGCCWGG
jgi:hypothetical protein